MKKLIIFLLTLLLILSGIALFAQTAPIDLTKITPTTTETLPGNTPANLIKITKVAVTYYGDATTTKGFTWYTSADSAHSDLQVIEKTSSNAIFSSSSVLNFTGVCKVPTNDVSTTKTQEIMHKAEATGLKPNTSYYFRVGDKTLNIWSKTGTFKTASSNGAFTFLDLTDLQAKDATEASLAAGTLKTAVETISNPAFIAINGDIVNKGDNESEWEMLLSNMSDLMMNNTLVPVAGNHDAYKNAFIEHFDLQPAAGSSVITGAYYSFDYSNAHFVILNTNENSKTYSDFSLAQINWMKTDIAKAKSTGKWIIVLMHKGPYSTSGHATNADIAGSTGIRTLIAPIFAKLGVDLVLQGHDHIYARSKPIDRNGKAASENIITEVYNGQKINYFIDPTGTIYLIPATAGPKVYYKNKNLPSNYLALFDYADESHAAVYGKDSANSTRPVRSTVNNFESITIDGNRLTVVSFEVDHGGLIKPTEAPYIIDSFGIIKKTGN